MPHAVSMPSPGFQALILCGPGASLSTFTSNPEEFPKALIPIANRPMLWYPLDWCYRMGITDITLITPQSSAKAIDAALSQNPHLTSLPLPKADILSPEFLTQTSGTAEILRSPEVQENIKGDFVVLPCDLVSELAGESLLEAWMVRQAGIGNAFASSDDFRGLGTGLQGEANGQKGGLGVWFETKGEGSTKREETDFVITAPLRDANEPSPEGSLTPHLQELVYSTTTDTLKDILEENELFPLRQSMATKHPRTKILTTYRDAHVYLFPHWVLDMVTKNETMESISEDVLGWWAKAGWQVGLADKLGLRETFKPQASTKRPDQDSVIERDLDLVGMNTTRKSDPKRQQGQVLGDSSQSSIVTSMPPFLAYIHPRDTKAPLIRRVDTAALLLFVSLRLARLESIEDIGKPAASPFAHSSKIAYPEGVAQRTTINTTDCLLAENVTVESKSIIKGSVIGANCQVKTGTKLTRCVLMDGAVIGERCELTGCIIGRRAHVGKGSALVDCEVQDGNVIPDETDAKNEKFMVFEGLDASDVEGEEESGETDMLVE